MLSNRSRLLVFALACSPLSSFAQTAPPGGCPAIVAMRPTVVPPQRFKQGDIVPAFSLDAPPRWLQCPAPELPAGVGRDATKRVFLFLTLDENGAVVDVKPRGAIDAEGFFDSAVAAVRRWKATPPRWKSFPVRTSFAADIVFDPSFTTVEATAPQAPAVAPANTPPPAPVTQPEKPAPVEKPVFPPSAPPSQEAKPAPAAEPSATPVSHPPAASTPPSTPQQPQPQEVKPVAPPASPSQPVVTTHPPSAEAPAPAPAKPQTDPVSDTAPPVATTPARNAAPQPAAISAAPAVAAASSPSQRPCPQFFVLPASDQTPRTYRSGELVPNAYLDTKPAWVECPAPDFSGVSARTTMLIVVIDERGQVREVRPRGQAANAAFQRARTAVLGWRIAPAPRYKGLPVWTSTAMDLRADTIAPQRAAAEAPPSAPAPAAPPSTEPTRQAPASPAPQAAAGNEAPFAVEYYYKVKWGFAAEFWRLFLKNHLPVLRKQIESGRILDVRAEKPVYHATEDGRWDYRVTIVFRSAAAAFAPVDTPALERQLFPDQETFRREEQRRFELLLAHWDSPVETVPLPK